MAKGKSGGGPKDSSAKGSYRSAMTGRYVIRMYAKSPPSVTAK
mgnify:CR=1 FL=1